MGYAWGFVACGLQCPFSLLGFIAPLGLLSDDSALTAATLPHHRHKKKASVVMTEALIISILSL